MKRTNSAKWNGSRWRIQVQKNGIRKCFYSATPGRTGQREANFKADAWLDDGIDNTDRRVRDLYDDYAAEIRATTSSANAHKIESFGRTWIVPALGAKRISAVTENDLQQILNHMHREGLSKKSITNVRATIIQFFKYCRRIRVSALHPEFLEIPKGAFVKEKNILEPEDLRILFQCDKTIFRQKEIVDPLIHAYRFAVVTGLRPGELLGLQWPDIFDGVVHIRRSLNIHNDITKGKNQNAIRNFALSPLTTGILMEQLGALTDTPAHLWEAVLYRQRKAAEQGNTLITIPVGAVFPCSSEERFRKRWYVYCRHNHLTPVTPYELRHTFVSVIKSLPEGQIKGLVGHSQNMDTLGVYAHEMIGDMKNTADCVSTIFENILQSQDRNCTAK